MPADTTVTHDAAPEVYKILKEVANGGNLDRHEAERLFKQMKTDDNPAGTWSASGTYTSTK